MLSQTDLKELITITKDLTVLYVEDNKEARDSTILMLNNYFDDISVAVDGEDGLNQYQKKYTEANSYFDIVISDIEMPNLDGIAMTKEIYAISPKQKILIISAYTEKEYLLPLINMGISGFITKPFNFDIISETIKKTCLEIINTKQVQLTNGWAFDMLSEKISFDNQIVELNKNDIKLLSFLINCTSEYVDLLDIFNHLFEDEPFKEYSADSIRAIIKRCRQKTSANIITYNKANGYKINLA